jgi:hypothetical protein
MKRPKSGCFTIWCFGTTPTFSSNFSFNLSFFTASNEGLEDSSSIPISIVELFYECLEYIKFVLNLISTLSKMLKKTNQPNKKAKSGCFTIRCFDMAPIFSSLSLLHFYSLCLFVFLSSLSASNEDKEDNCSIPIYNREIFLNVSSI